MQRILIGLFITLSATQGFSQTKGFYLKPEVMEAFGALSNLHISDGRAILAPLAKQPNGLVDYLQSWLLVSEYLCSADPAHYREFLAQKKRYEERLQWCDASSPFYNYCLSRFHLHAMLAHAFAGDEMESALALRKAHSYYSALSQAHPDFVLTKELGALIHAFISAIPPAYEWVSRLVGLKGSLFEAQELWRDAMSDFTRHSKEWTFYHSFLHLEWQFLEANLGDGAQQWMMPPVLTGTSALDRIARMIRYQKNRDGAELLAEVNQFEQAGLPMIPAIQYWKAEVSQNLALPEGVLEFERFLLVYHGDRWRAAALRRIAWDHLLRGDELGYRTAMKRVLAATKFPADEDMQALQEAQAKEAPHPKLLRARLLTDAGSFRVALNVLNQLTTPLSGMQKVEWNYRKARAFQGLSQIDSAIVYFERARTEGASVPEYYAAASSYQLGLIHQTKDIAKAKHYFRSVAEFPKHPYKRSLDAKAAAALRAME